MRPKIHLTEAPAHGMTVTPEAEAVAIELDERCYLFPNAKPVTHLKLVAAAPGYIVIEALLGFNRAMTDTRLAILSLEDATQVSRKLVDAYFQGKTQHALSDRAKVAIVFNANGFLVSFEVQGHLAELFISPPALQRFTRGLMQLVDALQPIQAN